MLLLLLLNGFRGRGVCGGAGAVRCQQLGTDASCTARDERLVSFQGTNERDLREGSESDSGRERERESERSGRQAGGQLCDINQFISCWGLHDQA